MTFADLSTHGYSTGPCLNISQISMSGLARTRDVYKVPPKLRKENIAHSFSHGFAKILTIMCEKVFETFAFRVKRSCKKTKEGGCEWYQSIDFEILYIASEFKFFLKVPGPLNSKKTFLSSETTVNCVLTSSCSHRRQNLIPLTRYREMFTRYLGLKFFENFWWTHYQSLKTAGDICPVSSRLRANTLFFSVPGYTGICSHYRILSFWRFHMYFPGRYSEHGHLSTRPSRECSRQYQELSSM